MKEKTGERGWGEGGKRKRGKERDISRNAQKKGRCVGSLVKKAVI